MADPVVKEVAAPRCTSEGTDGRAHHSQKYTVISGDGVTSGKVFCETDGCSTSKERAAITAERQRKKKAANAKTRAAGYTVPAKERDAGTEFLIRARGWLFLIAGLVFLWKTLWLLAGLFGVLALWFFTKRSPAPCLRLPVPCPNGAHGVLRNCADREHRRENGAEIGALVHHLRWPPIWDDWPGRRALGGFVLAAALSWGSLLGYLATTRAWWMAVLADVGLAAVVIGGIVVWRRIAARRSDV